MAGWSPPAPPLGWVVGIAVLFAVVLLYTVLIQGSILIGLLPGVVLAALYVLWRFLVAFEAVADGVHRIADERDRD